MRGVNWTGLDWFDSGWFVSFRGSREYSGGGGEMCGYFCTRCYSEAVLMGRRWRPVQDLAGR